MAAPSSSTPPVAPPAEDTAATVPVVDERGTSFHDTVRARVWSARGVAKVVGDVEVERAELDGSVSVGGDLTAGEITVRGSLEVVGAVLASGAVSLHGSLRAGGGFTARDALMSGTLRSDAAVAVAGAAVVRGSLAAPSVTATSARFAGTVTVPGDLESDSVELELDDGSSLGSVRARSVRVLGPEGGLLDRLLGRSRRARIERIEGDTVELDRVEVGFVSATKLRVGRECHVGATEATELSVHPSARVGPESRTPPPRGLRR